MTPLQEAAAAARKDINRIQRKLRQRQHEHNYRKRLTIEKKQIVRELMKLPITEIRGIAVREGITI